MTTIPTSRHSAPSTAPAAPDPALPVRCTVVLVGPEAAPLREDLEKLLGSGTGSTTGPLDFVIADSMLEAVFLAAEATDGPPPLPLPETLIFAGVTLESEQLESATRSLRKVYPHGRIFLLCDAGDEVLCRRARAWGATDYLLLPVDAGSLQQAVRPTPRVVAEFAGSPLDATTEKLPIRTLAAQQPVRAALDPSALATLPLVVQTSLLNDLMAGRSNFLERAVATLQSYLALDGVLTFARAKDADADALPDEGLATGLIVRAPIQLAGQPAFGTLLLARPPGATPFPAVPPALLQAAQWLGALLSISYRYEQLRTMAITDELSGAYNRRYFNKFMAGLLERARQNRFRVTLLLFDIDDFKKYNDSFGHASGDAIIRELIQLLRGCTRPHDIVARLGGDEFAVVYWDNEAPRQPNSQHPKDVLAATERFRNAVKCHEWPRTCNVEGQISISGGLATFPWDADSLEQLMAKADEALLRAKTAGKNVILIHGDSERESVG